MSWVAAAIAGGAVLGAVTSNQASKRQAQAGQQAIDTQNQMFQQNQANLAPWMTSGQNANTALSNFLGIGPGGTFNPNAPGVKPFGVEDFRTDPGYEWAKNQGLDAVLNKRSAMGGLFSGNTMRSLEQYGQGLADQQYQSAYNRYNQDIGNIYSRIGGLSNTGANTAGQVAGLGANEANQVSNLQTGIGNVQGAGIIGQGNAVQGGLNNWLLAQALQQGQVPIGTGGVSNIPAGFGGTATDTWYG